MSAYIFVIDGYLSNYQRISVCDELISQLKKYFPEIKILLINKFNNSFGLESKVDYYFYYGDGFMVGHPPQDMIDDKRYNKPYVYFDTNAGTLENWMPYTGVTDHVANVYNGFIISSRVAKSLGYEKIFRIEYDMLFHENDIELLRENLLKLQEKDFLFFGRRKEGIWAAEHLSYIDLHFCGYSHKLIENLELVRNDEEFWNLCHKIKYWGKWTEYVVAMSLELNLKKFDGIEYQTPVREIFKSSYFDRISSSGAWEDKWLEVPKFCKLSRDCGKSEQDDEILIFYWNNDSEIMKYEVKSDFGYEKTGSLNKHTWFYDIIKVPETMNFECLVERDNQKHYFNKTIKKQELIELNTRFLLK